MRPGAPTLLVILLLAGCATPTPDPDATPSPSMAPEWVEVDPAGPGSEPTIAVTPAGAIFLQAVGGTGRDVGESWAWRSDDGGRTWTRLALPEMASADTFDGAIAATDERVWIANAYNGVFVLYRSDDGGETWVEAAYPPLPPSHRMWLAVAGSDDLDVGVDSLGGPTFHFHVERATATSPRVVAPNYDVGGSLARRASDGLLIWPRHESAPSDRFVAYRSSDEGETWTSAPITGGALPETFPATPARRTSIWMPTAFDDAGAGFFATSAIEGGTSAVLLTRSLDGGKAWSPFVALTYENETATMPWLAARRDGELLVAAYASDGAGSTDRADAAWRPILLRVRWPANADVPEITRIDVPPLVVEEGPLCTYGQGCDPATRALGEFPTVAFTAEGALAVYASADATAFDSTALALRVPAGLL